MGSLGWLQLSLQRRAWFAHPQGTTKTIFSLDILSTLGQQRAGKVLGALGSCGLGFACFLGAFHRQRGCSGLPFSWAEPTLCAEHGGETQGEQRFFFSHGGEALLSSGMWQPLVTQGLVPNLLLNHPYCSWRSPWCGSEPGLGFKCHCVTQGMSCPILCLSFLAWNTVFLAGRSKLQILIQY